MYKCSVKLNNSYDIIIDKGLLENVGEYIAKCIPGAKKALVVSDSNVYPLYFNKVKNSLEKVGIETAGFQFEAGEESKNFATYESVIDACIGEHLTREDVVVALGGGVVGDIAGFAAATFMRGIKVVQLPTTLLAGIDSSIGGKTGIDIPQGKNLVGAFHQPSIVLYDLNTLETLPAVEFKNGLGEGIKYAILMGGRALELLLKGLNEENIEEFVGLCAQYKADIVVADEKESGQRKLLNLGHTIGHAIEKKSNYTMPHGAAVIKGILYIAKGAVKHGSLQKEALDTIVEICKMYELDYKLDIDAKDLISEISSDKKMHADGSISFIDIEALGLCKVKKTTIKGLEEYIL